MSDPAPKETTIRSHYECPACEFDDAEAGNGPWPPGDYWCPVCAEDNGRDVLMRCTRIAEDASNDTPTTTFAPVASMDDLLTLDENEILAGYMDWRSGEPEPGPNRGRAYWHGWMNAARDRGERPSTPQAAQLAEEYLTHARAH